MGARGFTLIELLVALSLLVVLSLIAAPSFGNYLRDCRRSAAADAITHAVHAARLLAATHGLPVEICPSRNGRDCAPGADWSGMLLLRQRPAATPDASAVRIVQLPTGKPQLTVHVNRDSIRFTPLVPAATAATITVCDDRGADFAAAVIVSRSGRPRQSGRDAGGAPLQCP